MLILEPVQEHVFLGPMTALAVHYMFGIALYITLPLYYFIWLLADYLLFIIIQVVYSPHLSSSPTPPLLAYSPSPHLPSLPTLSSTSPHPAYPLLPHLPSLPPPPSTSPERKSVV